LNSGRVIAVGPGARDRAGNLIPVSVKEGDNVLLPEFGGTQVKLGEKEYVLNLFDVIPLRVKFISIFDFSLCVSFSLQVPIV